MGNFSYGPDTEELLRRIANIKDNKLNICSLRITSLPDLPLSLQDLNCSHTLLTQLPSLPPRLMYLDCSFTHITKLPPLPSTLIQLYCCHTPITELPELPNELTYLKCSDTFIKRIPHLPSTLIMLFCKNEGIIDIPQECPPELHLLLCREFPTFLPRNNKGYLYDVQQRWREWRVYQRGQWIKEELSKHRIQKRSRLLKEDLVAAVWHPRRVEKLVEQHGMEVLDGL
jgi:Leucine-rich repeat (LRR) protein